MFKPPSFPAALTLLAAAALVACGDDPASSPGQRFAASIGSVATQARPLAADAVPAAAAPATATISNDQVFAWAQLTYPELFPGVPATFADIPYQGKVYSGRAYANGNYLAVAGGEAWGLGPFTNLVLTNYGAVQGYATLVCAKIDCGRSGPLGACAPSAAEMLRTASRQTTTHVVTSLQPAAAAREVSTETVVDGPATFMNQSAVRVTTTQRDALGAQIGAAVRSYLQAVDGGLVRTLGTESVATSGQTTRVVYEPTLANSEYTLQSGETLTQVQSTSTSTVGSSTAAVPGLRAVTYTLEAREKIDVQGRSYDTCRYREVALGTTTPVKITWAIVGSGVAARTETRNAAGTATERSELKSGSVNGAPIAPGQATLDVAAAERMVTDYSYILPICTPGGSGKASGMSLADVARKALELRQAARVAAAAQTQRRTLAYTATKPADQLGECGGRQTFPSYSHNNGVTTATMRWDSYCSKVSATGGTKVLNGSWSFVETATPAASGPVVTRYEGGSSDGIAIVDKDAAGKTVGSQLLVVVGLVSTPGVPGGDATAANPDRLQAAEWQVRNTLTGKTYRQTDYKMTTFETADGGSQMSISGRGYRSNGYYDLRTTTPIVSDSHGDYLSGVLTSTGADGTAVVITVVPGDSLQGTMTVGGKAVTTAPACK